MPKIPEQTIEQIRETNDIVEVVGEYVPLKRRGRNYFGICPFHQEDTASFSVSPDKQIYHCFGCGKGGNVYSFIMEYERIDFIEAVKKLAGRSGIEIPNQSSDRSEKSSQSVGPLYDANAFAMRLFEKALYSDQGFDALNYLKKRDFTEDTLREFHVGYAPDFWDTLVNWGPKNKHKKDDLSRAGLIIKRNTGTGYYDRFRNRIMFPIQNVSGRVVAFGGRALDPDDKAKYMNSPESTVYQKRKVLYGLWQSKEHLRKAGYLFVVEGYTDLLRLWENGIHNIIAVSGTAFTEEHAKIIGRYVERAILCYDSDTAGVQATLRAGKILLQKGIGVECMALPDGEDPDSFVTSNSIEEFVSLSEDADSFLQFRARHHSRELQNTSAKTRFIHETLQEISDISDPIAQELQIHELADLLKVDETNLLQEFKSKYRRSGKKSYGKNGNEPSSGELEYTGLEKAQYELLKLLLSEDEELITYILERVTLEEFTHPGFRNIAEVFLQELAMKPVLEQDGILDILSENLMDDPEELSSIQKVISRMLFDLEQTGTHEQNQKLAKDCLKRLELSQLDREVERINTELQSAGDVSKDTLNLLEQRQTLERLKQEVRQKYR